MKKTSISNVVLKSAVKAFDTLIYQHEDGVMRLPVGTYHNFVKSRGNITCELAKNGKKNRGVPVTFIENPEQQEYYRNLDEGVN